MSKGQIWIDTKPGFYARDGALFTTGDLMGASSAFTPTSGTLYLTFGRAYPGTISNLSYAFVAAATLPANWWFALYDDDLALVAQTADQTTTAIGVNSMKTVALTTPYTVKRPMNLYAGFMLNAVGVATVICVGGALLQGVATIGGVLRAGSSTTGLTTTPPNPAASLTFVAANLWCIGA